MAEIAACYLHPVKGMPPVAMPSLELEPGRSPKGDRAFVFAFATARPQGEYRWVSKHDSVTMLNTPHLARLLAAFDPSTRRLTIEAREGNGWGNGPEGDRSASANVDDPGEREVLAAWVARALKRLPSNPLAVMPAVEPLQLLGDGRSAFTDRGPTQVSLGTVDSLRSLSEQAGVDIDIRRFRLNLIMSGVPPWEELSWGQQRLRIGTVVMVVRAPLVRCNSINASPEGAGRDVEVMSALLAEFGHAYFGVEAEVLDGGRVSVGDGVELIG